MNAKRWTALLLALMMVFALTACSGSGKTNEKAVEAAAQGKAESYEAMIAALENVYNNQDATVEDAMKAAFGADFAATMMDFYESAKEMGEASEEDMADVNILGLDSFEKGKEVKIEIAEAKALDEDAVKKLQESADGVSESMEMISQFSAMYDEMSEEELAEAGMTQDDLAKMKSYIGKMLEIGAFFDGCTIEEAADLKLNVTVDGETQEIEKTVVKLNGNWVLSDMIDLMG